MMQDDTLSTEVPGLSVRTDTFDLSEWEIPHPNPFLCDIRIQAEQISRAIAHVSNIEYVKWLDRAAELHSDHLGYSRQTMLDRGVMWFVARHEIDYLAEVWPDDRLILATWVRDMTRVKSWREFQVIRPGDGLGKTEAVCKASTLWVLVDLEKRKPMRIPDDMVSRFEPLEIRSAQTLTPRTP